MREPLHIRQKRSSFKSTYSLTLEEAEEILSRGCQICGEQKGLCIDHNHKTGKVRGCLCRSCNTRVGKYEKGLNLLKPSDDIVEYLIKS